jgi:hypothetical protein
LYGHPVFAIGQLSKEGRNYDRRHCSKEAGSIEDPARLIPSSVCRGRLGFAR